MEDLYADLCVIGTGPAGQKAAIQAAKLGKKVVAVEKGEEPGGACLHSGTIPSKSLREAILDFTRFHDRAFRSGSFEIPEVLFSDLNTRLSQVIDQEKEMICRQFKKNNIEILKGVASFEDELRISVCNGSGKPSRLVIADYTIISSGSQPRNPMHVPFDGEVILDSTRILKIKKIPKTMLVLGGGVIGSEYASFFAALGTEVTVIDKKEQVLPLLDKEIGMQLQTALSDLGMRVAGNKVPKEIYREGNRAKVRCEDGSEFEADCLLYALGREANVKELKIENANLNLCSRGYIPVNSLFQTAQPHIYAVGDVIGGPSLASTSMEQGRLAARHAFGADTHHFPKIFPLGIYTIPEISTCGLTEEELKKLGFHYEVGRAYYYEIARGHITGSPTGMFKILFHSETLAILGIHIIGRGATEMIHIGQVAMSFRAHVDYFIDQVFNYPTYAEGYRIAALNGMNKIKHRV